MNATWISRTINSIYQLYLREEIMKKTRKKLRLHRDTVRALAQPDLENAEGGVPPPTYLTRCLTQCPVTACL